MRSNFTIPVLALILGAASVPASAQIKAIHISVSPTAGWYAPISNLDRISEGDGSVAVRRQSSPMVGVAVEAKLPGMPVSARGQYAHAIGGSIVAKRLTGQESCGTDCVRFIYSDDQLSSSTTLLAVADAVVRAQVGRLRPYVAAGGGVRRYGFQQSELEPEFADAFSKDVTRLVAHLGAGLEANTRSVTAQVEFGDYFGRYPSSEAGLRSGMGFQHDLSVSFGVRFNVR